MVLNFDNKRSTAMKDKKIEKILPRLVNRPPLAYDLKADGQLVVIDAQGRKLSFTPADYQPLYNEEQVSVKREKKGGEA